MENGPLIHDLPLKWWFSRALLNCRVAQSPSSSALCGIAAAWQLIARLEASMTHGFWELSPCPKKWQTSRLNRSASFNDSTRTLGKHDKTSHLRPKTVHSLSIYPSIHPSIRPSVRPSIHPSIHLFSSLLYLSTYLPTFPYTYPTLGCMALHRVVLHCIALGCVI